MKSYLSKKWFDIIIPNQQVAYLMISKLAILCLLIAVSYAAQGVIVSTSFTNYTCLRNQKKDLAIIRALMSTGSVDTNALNNIKLANQAGFLTDVYALICPGKDASTQINQLIVYLNGSSVDNLKLRRDRLLFQILEEDNQVPAASIYDGVYGNIWISVDTNSAIGCSWQTKTQAQSCDYVSQVVKAVESQGRSAGIFSRSASWKQIVGDNCTALSGLPVMYANIGTQSFDDWSSGQAFGGWKEPNVKNYVNDAAVCGTRFGLLYF